MASVNISELMAETAQDAVHFAKEQQQLLDFNLESIANVQIVLDELRNTSLSEKDSFTLSYMFGAYLGELFIRHFGGHWFYQDQEGDEPPQTFVVRDPYRYAFPSIIFHYLNKDEEYTLVDYFEKIKQQHQ